MTHTAASILFDTLSTASSNVNAHAVDLRAKKQTREAAGEVLRKRMRDLINELA